MTIPTRALTIRDPWAQAIVWGDKRVENRVWKPPSRIVGEMIAIHCGKALDENAALEVQSDLARPPLSRYRKVIVETARATGSPATLAHRHHPGCIIGIARIIGVRKIVHDHGRFVAAHRFFMATGYPEPPIEDPWFEGGECYGWLLDDVQALAEPVPCRGAQGLWRIPEDVAARMEVS